MARAVNAAELTAAWAERFGAEATTEESFGLLTVDVPVASWTAALEFARDELGCGYFDWLTGVDELADGFRIVVHVFDLDQRHHLLIRTLLPRANPAVPTATGIYRGAGWHERETFEMFGVSFEGHPDLKPLLLPEGFEGNPLRKEFVLAARVAKPWPGAKEPGESGHGAPSRRRVRPPGVPDDWGPQAAAPAAPERPRRKPREPRRPAAGTEPTEPTERTEPKERGVQGGGDE
jgi:NADH-quinone oxidoreductase subunit C